MDPLEAPAATGLAFQIDGESWGVFQDPASEVGTPSSVSPARLAAMCGQPNHIGRWKVCILTDAPLCRTAAEAIFSQSQQEHVDVDRPQGSAASAKKGEDLHCIGCAAMEVALPWESSVHRQGS